MIVETWVVKIVEVVKRTGVVEVALVDSVPIGVDVETVPTVLLVLLGTEVEVVGLLELGSVDVDRVGLLEAGVVVATVVGLVETEVVELRIVVLDEELQSNETL
jgi:hypothetical protein